MPCDACGAELEDGYVHVQEQENPAAPVACRAVTAVDLEQYFAAHCTNCGAPHPDDGRKHLVIVPGCCRVLTDDEHAELVVRALYNFAVDSMGATDNVETRWAVAGR